MEIIFTPEQNKFIDKTVREMVFSISKIQKKIFTNEEKFHMLVAIFSYVIGWVVSCNEIKTDRFITDSIDAIAETAKKIANRYIKANEMH